MGRQLQEGEARKLLTIARAAEVDRARKEVGKWPGNYNLQLLAQAVSDRRMFVDFESPDERFSIKYDDVNKAIFVSPTKGFVPCGWFNYDTLKQVVIANDG